MKKITIAIIFALMISTAFAQNFNYASVQLEHNLNIIPGGEIETKILFYNYYGDVNTHVLLSTLTIPDGWKINLSPKTKVDTFDISGLYVNVTENFFVTPETSYEEKKIEEGYEYIEVTGIDGFVRAKVLTITLTAPKTVKIRQSYNISLGSSATWLSTRSATVSMIQERSFK